MTELDSAVEHELEQIYDPCSVAAGRPTGLCSMGLVLGWDLAPDGLLHVRFCVTFAGCTMAPHFTEAARTALLSLPGVRDVCATVDGGFLWTPDRMRVPASPAHPS